MEQMSISNNPLAPFIKGEFKVPLNKGGLRGLSVHRYKRPELLSFFLTSYPSLILSAQFN